MGDVSLAFLLGLTFAILVATSLASAFGSLLAAILAALGGAVVGFIVVWRSAVPQETTIPLTTLTAFVGGMALGGVLTELARQWGLIGASTPRGEARAWSSAAGISVEAAGRRLFQQKLKLDVDKLPESKGE